MEYLLPLAMVGVFYFFIIRPQAKKQKAQKDFSEALKKGDDVVTNSGMMGKISKVEGNIITIQVGQKNFIRFFRGSISREMTELLPKVNSTEVVDTNVKS